MGKKLLFLIFIFYTPCALFAQNATLSSNPPSVRWERVITPYFNVVYPIGFEHEAQRTANLLETVYEPGALSLEKFPKKTSVILQNQTTVSNGFVAWAPYRSEFNTFPSQNYQFVGNNDWLELLSFHEYRHMVQIQKSKVGFTKLINILFGQATTANLANLAAPRWFWEGDATIMETALTSSGRGRIPAFSLQMRSNFIEKKPFSYNKQYLGSFKENIPGEYVMGYFFGGYLREMHGADIFADVTKNAWTWSFVPFTFSNSLKKYTGKFLVKNYNLFRNDKKSDWQAQIDALNPEKYDQINQHKNKVFTDYSYPHLMSDGKILVLKNGLGDIPEFVKLDANGNEEHVVTPGFINPAGRISFNNRQIMWNEVNPDPRWRTRVYSDIKLFDLQSNSIKKISRKERNISSAISPDGSMIASIVNETNGTNLIKVSDLQGNTLAEFYHENNVHYITPEWSADSRSIFVVESEDRNKRIVRYSIDDDSSPQIIFEADNENISYPKIYSHYLFYQSPYNGIDNIYVIDLASNKHYQATNAKYGAYYPCFDPATSTLYFSDHQESGLNIVRKNIDFNKLPEKSTVPIYRDPLASILTNQESGIIEPEEISTHDFPVEKYSKLKGIINPHSWGVLLGSNTNELNLFVSSSDIRSTTQVTAGYAYNANEEKGRWEAEVSYHGMYPVTSLTYSDAKRGLVEEIRDTTYSFVWDEKGVQLGLTVPLLLTQSKYQRTLVTRAQGGFFDVGDFPSLEVTGGTLQSLKLDIVFNRQLKRNKRDIYSKWGQTLDLALYSTPFGGDFKSTLFAAQGAFFFPGLAKHHSFFIRPAYQYEDRVSYVFRSPLIFPRGYTYSSFDHFFMNAANYTLPVLYPDLGLGPLLYIQRVRANLYYDLGKGIRFDQQGKVANEKVYQSMGTEVNFDINVFRYKPLFNIGLRINYFPDENSYSYNILIANLGF